MTKQPETYPSLHPTRYRLQQYAAALLTALMLLAVLALMLLALLLPAPLFLLMGVVVFALIAPVFMQLALTVPVQIHAEGIELQPILWRNHLLHWNKIDAIVRYPLLPTADQEVVKRALHGREKYEVARGVMLISDALPLQYRVAGLFVGVAGRGIVAVTNRTHARYDDFLAQVEAHAPHLLKEKVDANR